MTSDEAITKARALAEHEGWLFREPASARLVTRSGQRRWEVMSNAHALGAKVRVVLDADSGEVIDKGYVPR